MLLFKRPLLIFVFVFFVRQMHANIIDDFRNEYYSSANTKNKRAALSTLCENFKMLPIDTFKYYVNALLSLNNKQTNKEEKLLSYYYKSICCLKIGQADSFLYYFKTCETEMKDYPSIQMKFANAYGSYFVKKNMHEDAFKQFYNSLRLAESTKDTTYIVGAKLGIGWTYMEMNQTQEAILWFQKSLAVTENKKLQINYPSIYNNLASCYGGLGKFDSSKFYCKKALELSHQNGDLMAEANANCIMANLYTAYEQFTEAENSFMEGYRIHTIIGDPFFIVSDMSQIAIHFANTKQYTKGIHMANDAIAYANKHGLDSKLIICYDALGINYKDAGDYEHYAEALRMMNMLKDSIYMKTSELAVAEMNTKYETEKKEKVIQSQRFEITKRNYWLFGGTGLFILSSLLGIMFIRNRNHTNEKKMQYALMKQQDLASKAIIEAEENERRRIAADLHDGVGQMLTAVKLNLEGLTDRISILYPEDKKVYEKVKMMVEDSCKEVRNVSHNIMPNALIKSGLGNAVKDFIDKVPNDKLMINLSTTGINEKLSSDIEIVVYRVIQECVNNVIKHADANKLDISIIKDQDGLNVSIEDNGKGFNVSSLEDAKGIGMRNIKTRIEYLKGSIDIDSKPGNGTLIAFYIPIA